MANTSNIPQSLIDALKAHEVVPFIGAGVSRAIKTSDGAPLFPSWKEFLLKAADKLNQEINPEEASTVRSLVNNVSPDTFKRHKAHMMLYGKNIGMIC